MADKGFISVNDLNTKYTTYTFDFECTLAPDSSSLLNEDGNVSLLAPNYFVFKTSQGHANFSVNNEQDALNLTDLQSYHAYNIACMYTQLESKRFILHIVFFYKTESYSELDIAISDQVRKHLLKKNLVSSTKQISQEVVANFLIKDGTSSPQITNPCFAYAIQPFKRQRHNKQEANNDKGQHGARDDRHKDELKTINDYLAKAAASASTDVDYSNNVLVLYGKKYALKCKLIGSEMQRLFAYEIDTKQMSMPPLRLCFAQLSFTGQKQLNQDFIAQELQDILGYLTIWDKYTNIEGEFLLKKARQVDVIDLNLEHSSIDRDNFIKIYPRNLSDDQRKLLIAGDQIVISEKKPVYLEDPAMTFAQYYEHNKSNKSNKSNKQDKQDNNKNLYFTIERLNKDGSILLSNQDGQKPKKGIATLSIDGDYSQIVRRRNARDLITNAKSANPALGLLIEGKLPSTALHKAKRSNFKPLSPHVLEKVFKQCEPRQKQKDAIDIALNTPDIALIQGPPGTGKTTVITAIVERLNELMDKRSSTQGEVLITSFQHDAVLNASSRLTINSLPTPKFGRQGADDLSQEYIIDKWRNDFVARLKEKNPQLNQSKELTELLTRRDAYLISPSAKNALNFLEYAQDLTLDMDLRLEIDNLIADFKLQESDDDGNLMSCIRRLRVTKEGFMDDGPERADEVLITLEKNIDTTTSEKLKFILATLDKAALIERQEISDVLLRALQHVRDDLIRMCTPPPKYNVTRVDEQVLSIYDRLKKTMSMPKNKVDAVLYELMHEVSDNPFETVKFTQEYNLAYAVTAQQSEGSDIRKMKGLSHANLHPEYDTVIIDEAARVNPGDLIIPMTQGKRRIILVGDHRQLPHIYDEEIFESMRAEGENFNSDVVTTSMFEYIKGNLEELEKTDGIKRTITLDAQYRMHPVLGNFVNDNFYAPYNEGFSSPLDSSLFTQEICDKPYMWVNLPFSYGDERKRGVSRVRYCEAEYIVNTVKKYLNSPEGASLSFGVITFYRAQKDLIASMLDDEGLLGRVKVGSVDAFQGMEFDVIFLSVVRTNNKQPKFDEDKLIAAQNPACSEQEHQDALEYKELVGTNHYGRLISENLLCVALSRQKRLLIVVGDANIVSHKGFATLAKYCVPALHNFYNLCKNGGKVIDGEL